MAFASGPASAVTGPSTDASPRQIAAKAACATSARPNEHTMNARSPAVAAASFIQAMGAVSRLERQSMFLFRSVKNVRRTNLRLAQASVRLRRLGLSLKATARKIGVDEHTVLRWERGDGKPRKSQYAVEAFWALPCQ